MNTAEIKCILRNVDKFKGVFSRDTLPKVLIPPFGLIANTDISTTPGQHWIAIYLNSDGSGEYFDSFGLMPIVHEFKEFMINNCTNGWSYNPVILQTPSYTSLTCGHYCTLFILCKNKNLPFKTFLNLFSTNTMLNDFFAKNIVKENTECLK